MKKCFLVNLFVLLFGLTFSLSSHANSTINNFDSAITVKADGTIVVQENINVTTDGISIRHGIYRDFPLVYTTTNGAKIHVGFHLDSAYLDNEPVPYSIANIENGVRIYLGNADRLLPAGTYNFTLVYSALGELGFFQDHDELYWNVTGNHWQYPIMHARAFVQLPAGADKNITGYKAYTGYMGSREENYQSFVSNDQTIQFQTTKPLLPYQGFTIVVGWNKGFIHQPTLGQFFKFNQSNNFALIILEIGLLASLCFYYYALAQIQRERISRAVIPEYEPPAGFTPDALRYILEMSYDDKVLAAAILNLAVKGQLIINESKSFFKTSYTLTRQSAPKDNINEIESGLLDYLFKSGDTVELKQQSFFLDVVKNYKDALSKAYTNKYFVINYKFIFIGFFMVIGTLGATVLINSTLSHSLDGALFLLVFTLIFAQMPNTKSKIVKFIVFAILLSVFWSSIGLSLAQSIFAGPTAWIYCILLFLLVSSNLFFSYFMKHHTIDGQKLINHMNGFKLFLNATEKDRLNFRNPPDRTPEIFEKYLPYALALGVEQKWAEQFSGVLTQANYQPQWYAGSNLSTFNPVVFTSVMSSGLSSAVSAAAPGQTSGFSSGGGSGGGGGGGGGGGW